MVLANRSHVDIMVLNMMLILMSQCVGGLCPTLSTWRAALNIAALGLSVSQPESLEISYQLEGQLNHIPTSYFEQG
jgi:hypothetical protein